MLDKRSVSRLTGVHPDLIKITLMASDRVKFIITQGLRTREEQARLLAAGKTQTMNSRHLTGHAIDFAPWNDKDVDGVVDSNEISWQMKDFIPIADVFKELSRKMDIPIVWGGDWRTFKDGPHIELDRRRYP